MLIGSFLLASVLSNRCPAGADTVSGSLELVTDDCELYVGAGVDFRSPFHRGEGNYKTGQG